MSANTPSKKRRIFTILIMTLIVAGGIGTSIYWLKNKPRAQRVAPKVLPPLVAAEPVTPQNHRVTVTAMGSVTAAQSVELSAEVSGEVIEVNSRLAPGARLDKGELIARIDPADYELALRQKEAELVKAEYEFELELGQRAVAEREYELLGETIDEADRALVLREPHLKAANAAVDAAKAAVEQARLNLERTRIVAPFNAVVKERFVAVGTQLGSGTKVATLVDSDRYWIEATLPVDKLSWIRYGDTPSPVRILPRSPAQEFPAGVVKTILSDVEEQGRMARVLIEVPHPLSGGRGAPLLLGDLVTLSIEGKTLEGVIRIPRASLHHGNTVWLLTPGNTLEIIAPPALWVEKDAIYIAADAITAGRRLITTDLAGAVEGMQLRTAGAK